MMKAQLLSWHFLVRRGYSTEEDREKGEEYPSARFRADEAQHIVWPFFSGGSARQASAGKLSSKYWLMRSLVSKAESSDSERTKGAADFFGISNTPYH